MKEIITYLMFDGNAREAMELYQGALGGELHVMTFGESGQGGPEVAHRVMHAKLASGTWALMGSDTMGGGPMTVGNNFSVALTCESVEEQDRLYSALGEGGKATMPLQDTFWGARFGMLTDRFGVDWMLNFDHPRPAAQAGA